MKIIKKLTLLTLTLGLLAAPAGVKAMTTTTQSVVDLLHKNIGVLHDYTIKFISSIPNFGLQQNFKETVISELHSLVATSKKLSLQDLTKSEYTWVSGSVALEKIFSNYSAVLDSCYDALCMSTKELLNTKHSSADFSTLLNLRSKTASYALYYKYKINYKDSLIQDSVEQLTNIVNEDALQLTNIVAKDKRDDVVGLMLPSLVIVVGIFIADNYYINTQILRLCRNNDTAGLANFLTTQPWVSSWDNIHHNNNQPLRESAGSDYHEIVQILLNNGANISVNNYEPLTNALENNCTQTIALLLNHLHNNNLLDDAYNCITGEDIWSYLSDNIDMQERYKLIEQRFKTYRKRFSIVTPVQGDTIQDDITRLQAACIRNEVTVVQQTLINLQNSMLHVFDINSTSFEYEGQSLLHCASEQNNPEIIQLLLIFGHKANPTNKDGLTPLQLAQKLGNQEAIDLLLTSSTINIDNNKQLQRRGVTKKLLEHIALPISTFEKYNCHKKYISLPINTFARYNHSTKIAIIKYVCALHDSQLLVEKFAPIKPKQVLKGLPVGNILSFIATKDLPRKDNIKPMFNPGPK